MSMSTGVLDSIGGVRRIALDRYFAGERALPDEPFWIDQVLWDIPNTVEGAVRNLAASGAVAVTLHWAVMQNAKYANVLLACRELGLTIVVCDDNYQRRLWHWDDDTR